MNSRKLFLSSLVLNLGLIAIIGWALWRRAPQAAEVAANKPPTSIRHKAIPDEISARNFETNYLTAPFDWSELESADYQVYRDNLRAFDCPEERVRDIIVADIDALYARRVRDYMAPLQSQFWTLASQMRDLEETFKIHETALRKLDEERDQVLTELFGDSDPRRVVRNQARDANRKQVRLAQLDFLDEHKQSEVLALEAELSETNNAIRRTKFSEDRNENRRQIREQTRLAQKAIDEKLRAALSPEEFEEYQLRKSSGASIRYQLAYMDVSETEARAMAQSLAAQSEGEADVDRNDPKSKVVREQLRDQAQAQIQELLGADRYTEYQRNSDGRFQQTARVMSRLNLPEQTAVSIYQMQQEAEKLATQLRTDQAATAAEREAALNILRTETENSLHQVLGEQHFGDYQALAGQWLQRLGSGGK